MKKTSVNRKTKKQNIHLRRKSRRIAFHKGGMYQPPGNPPGSGFGSFGAAPGFGSAAQGWGSQAPASQYSFSAAGAAPRASAGLGAGPAFAAPAFGSAPRASAFGAPAFSSGPAFGAAPRASAFGAPAFGAATAAPVFGVSGFGAASAFGSSLSAASKPVARTSLSISPNGKNNALAEIDKALGSSPAVMNTGQVVPFINLRASGLGAAEEPAFGRFGSSVPVPFTGRGMPQVAGPPLTFEQLQAKRIADPFAFSNASEYREDTLIPSTAVLVSYERQLVNLKATITNVAGGVVFEIDHTVSSNLKETIASFKNISNVYLSTRTPLSNIECLAARIAAMAPKIAGDTAASWQIGEYIRRNSCVLQRQSSVVATDTPHTACLVVNYDTDTETLLCSDSIVCNHIPTTNYYTASTFLFINAEILYIMIKLAVKTTMRNRNLQEALLGLRDCYNTGLQYEHTMFFKRRIEEAFSTMGRFNFEYQADDMNVLVFESAVTGPGKHGIYSEIHSDAQKRTKIHTYQTIIKTLTEETRFEQDKTLEQWCRESFIELKSIDAMYVTMAALFHNMFGMDETFFRIQRTRVIDSLSRHNHDEAKDPFIKEIAFPDDDKPIRGVSVFKAFTIKTTEKKHFIDNYTLISWVPMTNIRDLLLHTSGASSAMAWNMLPKEIQSIQRYQGNPVELTSLHGVYGCNPSVTEYSNKQVLGASFDSQKPTITLTRHQSFFHTPPIPGFDIGTDTEIFRNGYDDDGSCMLNFRLSYVGTSNLLVDMDNKPFKTIGIVYINNQKEVTVLDGNTTAKFTEERNLYYNLSLLYDWKQESDNSGEYDAIPTLTRWALDEIFPPDVPLVTKIKKKLLSWQDQIAYMVNRYIDRTGGEYSLANLIAILDSNVGRAFYAKGIADGLSAEEARENANVIASARGYHDDIRSLEYLAKEIIVDE